MSKNKKSQKIETQLNIKSMAQLDAEIGRILKAEIADRDMSDLFGSGAQFAGYSPPHTIHGIPYEQLVEEKKKFDDENS